MRYRLPLKTFCALLAAMLLGALWLVREQPLALATEPADAAAVAEAIDRLPVVGSALLAAAHPDDENSQLLPYLARGLHVRAAYLSATRGDGGQNLLGQEQYEALGLLRTEELLAARRLDGAEQFFAQAYDFGFSKSAPETFEKWGREDVLGDFVRVIRMYRPDVLISRFSGTPRDGHGNHEAAGVLTKEAYRAAADPQRFPEQLREGLRPWQAPLLYLNVRGEASGDDAVTVSLDGFDPLHGRTYEDIGSEARTMHRSQGMGRGRPGRRSTTSFQLLDSAPKVAGPLQGLFHGVDLTLNRFTQLSGSSPAVASRVEAIQKAVAEARQSLSPYQPGRAIPHLAQGLSLLREIHAAFEQGAESSSKEQALFLLSLKETDFIEAIGLAGGVHVEAQPETGTVVPGQSFRVTVAAAINSPGNLQAGEVGLKAPAGWSVEKLPSPAGSDGKSVEGSFRVTVPANAPVSQPYWMVEPRVKDYFPVRGISWAGAAENPFLLKGYFQYIVDASGTKVNVTEEKDVVYSYGDRVFGRREQPLTVIPSLGVTLEPDVALFPVVASGPGMFLVKVRNNASTAQRGTVRLTLPAGWRSDPPQQEFSLAGADDEASARFAVTPPTARAGSGSEKYAVKAVAEANGRSYSEVSQVVDYPHVEPRYYFRPAVSSLLRFDVKVAPGLRVGYIMGTGDSIPEALRRLGVAVELLETADLAFGDLSGYDAIVTGIRAYEVRRDVVTNHSRLMEYVKNGGLLLVQYSRPIGGTQALGPYPMSPGGGLRVSVEEAPVEILEPSHPVFQSPNRITPADFEGWIQERGLYFMDTWDPQYQALLSCNDPGEPPLKGGMLVASYGKGHYVFSAYAWFRQLPAGVPGAYRLFANMISLGKTAGASR